MKSWRHILILISAVWVVASCSAQSFLERGVAAFQQGDMQQAERWFDWAITADSSDATAWSNRAQVRRSRNNHRGALEDLMNLIEIAPSNGDAHFLLGLVSYKLGRFDVALDANSEAIKLGCSFGSQPYMNRAQTYLRLGQNQKAIADLDSVLTFKDNNEMQASLSRGQTHLRMNNTKLAIADFKKVVEIDPTNLQLTWDIGQLSYNLEEYADALSYYSKAIDKLDTPQAQMLLVRGEVFEKLTQYEAAIQDYSRVIEMNPNLANAYYLRGQAKARMGSKEMACTDWKKAAELGHSEAKGVIVYNCK